jgi:hypothetical protein
MIKETFFIVIDEGLFEERLVIYSTYSKVLELLENYVKNYNEPCAIGIASKDFQEFNTYKGFKIDILKLNYLLENLIHSFYFMERNELGFYEYGKTVFLPKKYKDLIIFYCNDFTEQNKNLKNIEVLTISTELYLFNFFE